MGDNHASMARFSSWWSLVLVAAAACANHRNFVPRENLNGWGPGGQPAAVYPLASGEARGEVRLWSRGSDPGVGPDAGVTEVHVGFELENTGSVPLQLAVDALQCDELVVGEQRLAGVAAATTEGEPSALPGTTTRFHAWFRPGTGTPRDVVAFAVRFRIDAVAAPVLLQVTPFVRFVPESPWHDDPWLWSGSGFGWAGHYRGW